MSKPCLALLHYLRVESWIPRAASSLSLFLLTMCEEPTAHSPHLLARADVNLRDMARALPFIWPNLGLVNCPLPWMFTVLEASTPSSCVTAAAAISAQCMRCWLLFLLGLTADTRVSPQEADSETGSTWKMCLGQLPGLMPVGGRGEKQG